MYDKENGDLSKRSTQTLSVKVENGRETRRKPDLLGVVLVELLQCERRSATLLLMLARLL